MPREFYPDTDQRDLASANRDGTRCVVEITMFDGPGICMRKKGHEVDSLKTSHAEAGEFHQEPFEGWVWDNNGRVG